MGLPDLLYSDHGADFTSTHLGRVCRDPHIRLIRSLPGAPQGRGKIERGHDGRIQQRMLSPGQGPLWFAGVISQRPGAE